MKLGLISDVHGNWEALNAVLDQLGGEELLDGLFNCGDLVGYGPEPGRCIGELAERDLTSVKGNHDAGLLGELGLDFFNGKAERALRWTRKELDDEDKKFIEKLPVKRYLDENGIALVHGSFVNPLTHYIMRKADAFRSYQRAQEASTLQLFGHTHIPSLYEIDGRDVKSYEINDGFEFSFDRDHKYLLNPGSVGQPRDGNWKASFAVLELGSEGLPESVVFHRTEYQAEKAREKIINAGLPTELGDRLLQGR